MIETFHKETCRACHGTDIQHNTKTGLNVTCPVCNGTGYKQASNMKGLPPGVYSYYK